MKSVILASLLIFGSSTCMAIDKDDTKKIG